MAGVPVKLQTDGASVLVGYENFKYLPMNSHFQEYIFFIASK